MDIKQFEYFLAVCDRGSINKAAECLYTSQPNVSRVINNLENELGRDLFTRTTKGVELTPYGSTIRQYAEGVLKHIKLINDISLPSAKARFSLSTYRSGVISKIMAQFYAAYKAELFIEHYQGSVAEITDNVQKGLSELGIVYVAQPQLKLFSHILSHKNLEVRFLGEWDMCLYVGPKNPLYKRQSVAYDELKNFSYIRGVKEFFVLEHHLEPINIGFKEFETFNNEFYTNSDLTLMNLLQESDLCMLGINLSSKKYEDYNIKPLKIEDNESRLSIGYVYVRGQVLSENARWFIEEFTKTL